MRHSETETPLQRALAFIESLTVDPLLIADDIEMRIEDVREHAKLELASIRADLTAVQPVSARQMTAGAWSFRYEPATLFVTAFHPRGGVQSVLHFPRADHGRQFGEAIAAFLNGVDHREARP